MSTFKINSLKKKYDKQTSLSLALACDLAYSDDLEKITKQATKWGFDHVEFIQIRKKPDIDTQCMVLSDRKNIVVVFRGSDDIRDWLANFQAVRNPGPLFDTMAHEGFQDALYPAVIKLTDAIDRRKPAKKKIWVTGHSLGGALCSLYAGMLIENGYDVHGVYTFASPRPGDATFADQLNERVKGPHYRVVNSGDVVPHLPPEPFFSHAGNRIILTEKRYLTKKDSWWKQRVMALGRFVKITGNAFDVVDNHTLRGDKESYIPRLENALK